MHTWGRGTVGLLTVVVLALLATSCGRSGYQYIENEETGVYAKIPEEWSVISEGLIDFALVGEDGQMAILPGEGTYPWRAYFDAAPGAEANGFDRVLGAVEVQPVDRRLRSSLNLETLVGFDPNAPTEEYNVLYRSDVERNGLNGMRLIYETELSGIESTVDRLMLTADRFTTVYEVRIFCGTVCFADNANVIEEIMDTFTVEAD